MTQDDTHPCRFPTLSAAEQEGLRRAAGAIWDAPAGAVVRLPDERPGECQRLIRGFAVRYKTTADRPRQVTTFNVPGDFCDLHGLFFSRTNFFVQALTPCTFQRFAHASLQAAIDEHPGLGRALWQDSLVDAATEREWLLNIGRRSPLERVAHLLCELAVRLAPSGAEDAGRPALPISPQDISAAQALTEPEVGDVLAALAAQGLIEGRAGGIGVVDLARLSWLGLFDQDYLERRPMTVSRRAAGAEAGGGEDRPGRPAPR